ncbi:MAG: HD domain-containing protein [Trueperaceae bacterium]|nr:HD domain-containing protein [Trueperaceae bacterium]
MSETIREGGFIDEIIEHYVTSFNDKVENTDRFEHYSPGHARRVAETAVALAEGLMLDTEQIRIVKTSALLHDIGEVIQKHKFYGAPRKLSVEEIVEMWQHSLIGEREVARRGFGREEQLLVRWHHEFYNGSGYPDFLFGPDIPRGARIIRMADTWDALTHDRPWRKAYSFDDSVEEIKLGAGNEFDPELVLLFLDLLDEGTIVYGAD